MSAECRGRLPAAVGDLAGAEGDLEASVFEVNLLVFILTFVIDHASTAAWFPRNTDISAVQYQPVMGIANKLVWNDF